MSLSIAELFRSRRRSSSESSHDVAAAMGITRSTSITELNDLAARKKAEVDRLGELERERIQLLYVNLINFVEFHLRWIVFFFSLSFP